MPRKAPGGPRNSFLGIRLPEKTKYGLMLLSRHRREPVPDVVLYAIHTLVTTEKVGLLLPVQGHEFPQNVLDLVWAPRESDRFANLAMRYPRLLTIPEEGLWDLICADERFWVAPKGKRKPEGARREEELRRDVLAQHWTELNGGTAEE